MTKNDKATSSSGLRNIILLLVVVGVLYVAREIFIPLAFALTLSMILAPIVAGLRKLHLGRVPSAVLVIVVAMASVGVIGWVIFSELVEVAIELPNYRQNINAKIDALRTPGKSALGRAAISVKELGKIAAAPVAVVPPASPAIRRPIPDATTRPLPVQLVDQPASELQYLGDLIKPFLRPLAIFGMVLIFTLYLLIEQHDLRNRLFRLAGVSQLNVMTQALDDATQRVGRYLMLQLLVNICFGTLCTVGLFLLGVPYAALWGAVAALLRMVPYVGSLVAAALPLVLSLAVFDGWRHPLTVFLLFVVLEVVTGNLVEPLLYGTHTGVSSLALLLTAVFWSALWGPAGLILSTPLTVCVVVLGRYVPDFSFLHILLGDEDTLVAEAQVYQRLLAMDDQEARIVAVNYLKDHSLTQLYDSVFIPALNMAEQDRHKGALEPSREEFIFLSMREILGDLPESSAKTASSGELVLEPKIECPRGRAICIPAGDEADEIAAAMLAQLLERTGCLALALPFQAGLPHRLHSLKPSADDVICVSALPPFAFAPAKALTRKLRARFPHTRLVVGVWGFSGDTEVALERFQAPRPDRLVTTLEQAVLAVGVPQEAPLESIRQ